MSDKKYLVSEFSDKFLTAEELLYKNWNMYNKMPMVVPVILDSEFVNRVLIASIIEYKKQFD